MATRTGYGDLWLAVEGAANARWRELDEQRTGAEDLSARALAYRLADFLLAFPQVTSVDWDVESVYNDEGGYFDSCTLHFHAERDEDEAGDAFEDFRYDQTAGICRALFDLIEPRCESATREQLLVLAARLALEEGEASSDG